MEKEPKRFGQEANSLDLGPREAEYPGPCELAPDAPLIVQMCSDGNGGVTPMLCDRFGNPLPGQIAVDIHTAVGDFATVTVTFCALKFL